MKIALVTTNLRGGGAEKVFLRLAEHLAERGHETHVVLLEHIVDHEVGAAVRLHALTAPGVACNKGLAGKWLAAWRLRRLLTSLARAVPFDLVISTLPFADEVAAKARLPRLWHRIANTLSAEIARLSRAKAARRAARYRRLYGRANLIAVSEGVAADLREQLGIAGRRLVRIYNPYDFTLIRRLAEASAPERPSAPYVIHVGRFAPQKRHDLLLEAWRELDVPEQLVLLTQADPRLDALIDRMGLRARVTVAGFQRNPYPWIKGAKLLVLCSDHEGMPNVLVEALACGTPVVSTDCPSGPREILTGELAQWLVPCGDATKLAARIGAALQARPSVVNADLARFEAGVAVSQLEALAGA